MRIGTRFRRKKMLMKSLKKIMHPNSNHIQNQKKPIKEENIIKVIFIIFEYK